MVKKLSKIHQRLLQKNAGVQRSVFAQPAVLPKAKPEEPIDLGKQRVTFMGREAVKGYRFGENDVLISISDCGTPPPRLFHKPADMLALAFQDHVTTMEETQLGWRHMSRDDGEKVVDFVLKHESAPNIVVHCNYGQSRSKGMAMAIHRMTKRDILFADAFGRVQRFREEDDDGYYNTRVHDLVLMEYEMRSDAR